MLGILGAPIVPFMGITFGTWMKLDAHVSVNPREAQQATYNVRHIKKSIYQLFLGNKTKLANKIYV
jgi:hypothetical protein